MPQHTAEEQAKNALQKRSVAADPLEYAQELAAKRGNFAAPPEAAPPEPEGPGFLSSIADSLKGLFGGGGEKAPPAAPPPSTALSIALEKTRLGLPLLPEEQAAIAAAGQ